MEWFHKETKHLDSWQKLVIISMFLTQHQEIERWSVELMANMLSTLAGF